MNRFKYILFSAFLLVLSHSKSMAQDYFPLKENSVYYYKATYNGEVFHDSILIKSAWSLTSDSFDDSYYPFYFFDLKSDGTSTDLIGNGLFLGVYFYQHDSLNFINATDLEDLAPKAKKDGQLLLTFPLTAGQKLKVKSYDGDSSFVSVLRFEETKVPAGKFKNCAVVERISYLHGFRFSTDVFWLAENIGIVKIQRLSGRIDELEKYFIPKK